MAKPTKSFGGWPFFQFMPISVMPSPRCSFNVNSALLFVPTTSKPEDVPVCGLAGAGVAGAGADTTGFGVVAAGDLGLCGAGVVGVVFAAFGRVLLAGLAFALALGFDFAFDF